MREYDPRLIRLNYSVDALAKKYPMLSTYQFSGDNPIKFVDLDGLEQASLPPPGNNGYTTIYLASDHTTRHVGANETMANSSPNYNPDGVGGIRRLEALGKGLSTGGMVVAGVGVVLTVFPPTAPLGVSLIAGGTTIGYTGAAATTADDISQGDRVGVAIDLAGFGAGQLLGAGVKSVVKPGVKQEATQWVKDRILDAGQEEKKEQVKLEKLYDKKEQSGQGTPFEIKRPETPPLQSDKTIVSKPISTN